MSKIPDGFHANVLAAAFPYDHHYKIALFASHQYAASYHDTHDELTSEGYEPKSLHGYKLTSHGTHAIISFDRSIDWFDATIMAESAVIYDADSGIILSIMNFEKRIGVVGGVFSLSLNEKGVVVLGDED